MVIALNTKIIRRNELTEDDNFIFETFSRIIKLQPNHQFVLISEKKIDDAINSFENVVNIVIGKQRKNAVLRYLFHNIKIPAVLKKYKADVYISCNGVASLAIKIPQCIVVADFGFIHQPSFFKTFISRSLKKAKIIFMVSEFSKREIIKQYKTNADKIIVVYKCVNENFKAINYEEREEVKSKYTNGNEYFIYSGEIGSDKNLLNLLKAFSAFKKRQKSNMQLLIAGTPGWKYEDFMKSLRLFMFKNEVKILKNPSLEERINITTAAYAMVYPSVYDGLATGPLEAIKSGVPLIASAKGAVPEMFADAALYADTENFKEIAVKMMQLFRDENLRKELTGKGTITAEKFNWDVSAEFLWKNIEEVKR
ncbi:MAG TPA: glycosyltransferase family 1 protein [Ginsengibacter sp.]